MVNKWIKLYFVRIKINRKNENAAKLTFGAFDSTIERTNEDTNEVQGLPQQPLNGSKFTIRIEMLIML